MKFGPLPPLEAVGAILAHSIALPEGRLRKGARLREEDCQRLASAGLAEVTVARLGPDDVDENRAATLLTEAILPAASGLTCSPATRGRVNILAPSAGLLRLNAPALTALNHTHEGITIATLPNFARVEPGQLVATLKIIPYGMPIKAINEAAVRAPSALSLMPFKAVKSRLILTCTPGLNPGLLTKGAEAVTTRLLTLGSPAPEIITTTHEPEALARAIAEAATPLVLILAASATSDRADVVPAAIEASGGTLERVGMPVDPGNLLVLGRTAGGAPVLGLPGCARSPQMNGADWVLERILSGEVPSSTDIANMGVGGLLKEIPSRPTPRISGKTKTSAQHPFISALILAAGASSRMQGTDKLLEQVDGEPLLGRISRLVSAEAQETLAVLGAHDASRRAVLSGSRIVENPLWQSGMASSIRTGLAAVHPRSDAVMIVLADMPALTAEHIRALAMAFRQGAGEIIQPLDARGRPGHPVIFARRFFEPLSQLKGDRGAREILRNHPDFIHYIQLDEAVTTDLDTPEEWSEWRTQRNSDK